MAGSWPQAIKIFSTFVDQTQTIFAAHVNEIHDEIVGIETTIGPNPFLNTPYATLQAALFDLYTNKSPLSHTHSHTALIGDSAGNDHPQYARVDGSQGFVGPIGGVPAVSNTQLATLGQVAGLGFISSGTANNLIAAATANLIRGRAGGNTGVLGDGVPSIITGGYMAGGTDGNGFLNCGFGGAFGSFVKGFVATKLPIGGGAFPPYNFGATTIGLQSVSLGGATVVFSGAYNLNVAYSWIALGG